MDPRKLLTSVVSLSLPVPPPLSKTISSQRANGAAISAAIYGLAKGTADGS
jgi:hypothetical protein